MIFVTWEYCLEAIPSHKVKFDISCEILLNMSLSSRNARFRLTIISATRKYYFEAIGSRKVEIDISCEILLNVSLSSSKRKFWTN